MKKNQQTPPPAGLPSYIQPNRTSGPAGSKPWYKRKLIIIPALLMLGVVGVAGQDQDQPSQAATTSSIPTTPPTPATTAPTSSTTTESTAVPTAASETSTTRPAATSTTTTVPSSTSSAAPVVLYTSCDQVRDAGAAPLRQGDPGYSLELDRDGDGVACEPVAAKTTKAYVAPKATDAAPAATPSAPLGLVDTDAGSAMTYYANCSAVRAAGAAPIYRGQPGYSSKLDKDGDGVACE